MRPSLPSSSRWGLWPPVPWGSGSILFSFKNACLDVPTAYPKLRDVTRIAICMVGNPSPIVSTQLLVSDDQ